jgi:hypothetical protein
MRARGQAVVGGIDTNSQIRTEDTRATGVRFTGNDNQRLETAVGTQKLG